MSKAKIVLNKKPKHFQQKNTLEKSVKSILSKSSKEKRVLIDLIKNTVDNFRKDNKVNQEKKDVKYNNNLQVSFKKILDYLFDEQGECYEKITDELSFKNIDISNYITSIDDKQQVETELQKIWEKLQEQVKDEISKDINSQIEDTNKDIKNTSTTINNTSQQKNKSKKQLRREKKQKRRENKKNRRQNNKIKFLQNTLITVQNINKQKQNNEKDISKTIIQNNNNITQNQIATTKQPTSTTMQVTKTNFVNGLNLISKQITSKETLTNLNHISKNMGLKAIFFKISWGLKRMFSLNSEFSKTNYFKAVTTKTIFFFFPLLETFTNVFSFLAKPFKKMFGGVFKVLGGILGVVGGVFKFVTSAIFGVFNLAFKGVMSIISPLYNGILKVLNTSIVKKFVAFLFSPAGMYFLGFIAGFLYKVFIKPFKDEYYKQHLNDPDKKSFWQASLTKIYKFIPKVMKFIKRSFNFIRNFISKAKNFIVDMFKSNKMKYIVENLKAKNFDQIWAGIKLSFRLNVVDNIVKLKDFLVEAVLGNAGAMIGGAIGSVIGSVIPVVGTVIGGLIGSTLGGIIGELYASFLNEVPDLDDTKDKYEKLELLRTKHNQRYAVKKERKSILTEQMSKSDLSEAEKETIRKEQELLSSEGVQGDEEQNLVGELMSLVQKELEAVKDHQKDSAGQINNNVELFNTLLPNKIKSETDVLKQDILKGNFDGINPARYRTERAYQLLDIIYDFYDKKIDFETFRNRYNEIATGIEIKQDKFKIGSSKDIWDEDRVKSKFQDAGWGGRSSERKTQFKYETQKLQSFVDYLMENGNLFRNFGDKLTNNQKYEMRQTIVDTIRRKYPKIPYIDRETKGFQSVVNKISQDLANSLPKIYGDYYKQSHINEDTTQSITTSETPATIPEYLLANQNQSFSEETKKMSDQIEGDLKNDDKEKLGGQVDDVKDLVSSVVDMYESNRLGQNKLTQNIIAINNESAPSLLSKDCK